MNKSRELKKRQKFPSPEQKEKGYLYVVATPIGNLEDLSQRALRILKNVDAVLCEDTRRAQQLFQACSLPLKEFIRCDQYTEKTKILTIKQELHEGKSFALITDAGTPCVSDPGGGLIAELLKEGIRVIPIPGPSAFLSHASVSGLSGASLCFRGFLPRSDKALQEEMEIVSNINKIAPTVFYWFESPKRILVSLQKIKVVLEGSHVSLMKEISKVHEKIFYGSIEDVFLKIENEIKREGERGEWSIALQLPALDKTQSLETQSPMIPWEKALEMLLFSGVSVSEASKRISQYIPISKKHVYELALRITEKKS